MQLIFTQILCEVYACVRDPPICYKNYVFSERGMEQLPQPGMTRTQLLNNQRHIRLTTEQPYKITILNLDGNRLPTQLSEFVVTVAT